MAPTALGPARNRGASLTDLRASGQDRYRNSYVGAALLASLLVIACSGTARPPNPVSAVVDERDDLQRCRDLMAALQANDMNQAERDFDAKMRAELPPALLGAHWRALLSKHGPLAAWRVARRDGLYNKDRLTLESDLRRFEVVAPLPRR